MASTAAPTGSSIEALFLRENWSPEMLGKYEGEWIAVTGTEVIGHDMEIATLLSETSALDPLYAFVTFKELQ